MVGASGRTTGAPGQWATRVSPAARSGGTRAPRSRSPSPAPIPTSRTHTAAAFARMALAPRKGLLVPFPPAPRYQAASGSEDAPTTGLAQPLPAATHGSPKIWSPALRSWTTSGLATMTPQPRSRRLRWISRWHPWTKTNGTLTTNLTTLHRDPPQRWMRETMRVSPISLTGGHQPPPFQMRTLGAGAAWALHGGG